uniref:Olfactory receptor class A related 5 n=1 Tax=Takifugu rubripes TaxID=31033 RepID=A0A674NLH1_TAKRU
MFSLFLNCSALHAVVVGRLILVESIVRGLMFLAGVLGNNWLAVRSFPTQRSSVRTNEVLFLNLALSNLITNYLVDLPDTVADFAGRWFLGETYCGIFRFCADLSETSSIFTTLFISVFWHQKLVGSLKRGGSPVQMDSLCLVACLLAGSWTVAVVFSIPHFFFVKVEASNESSEDCIDVFPNKAAKQTYEIIYLTLANAVPVRLLLRWLRAPEPQPGGTDRTPEGGPRPSQAPAKPTMASSSQVRAAKSVVGVASVFLVCWLTHLLLRITNSVHTSSLVVEVASYIAASYTCIIPYIFLHGVKKLHCSCKR